MISDGLTASATGRGYVLRRIIRRMILQTYLLGVREPCLSQLYPSVLQTLGAAYPELIERQQTICQLLTQEENLFHKVIHHGVKVLNEYTENSEGCTSISNQLASTNRPVLPPKLVFSLYDSMGFPMDLTSLYAKKLGYDIDFKAVNQLLEEQRERGRQSWKNLCSFSFLRNDLRNSLLPGEETTFSGYQRTREHSKLIGYARDDNDNETQNIFICIDPCPFYAEGGGQIGDKGYLQFGTGEKIEITKCVKMNNSNILVAKYSEQSWKRLEDYERFGKPNFIQAVVDEETRQQASQNHTATHLLNSALRKILGDSIVHQAGSYVGPDRLRFDFTFPNAPSKEQLQQIEKLVRATIRQNFPVETKLQPYDEAIASGALSLDSCEKYSDTVRVVEIADEQKERIVSRELCGGTHVKHTSAIAPFIIVNESSVAAGVRRIEALTGEAAEKHIEENLARMQLLSGVLGSPVSEIETAAKQLIAKKKAQEQQIAALKEKILLQSREPPLCGLPPGELEEMKIHVIRNEIEETNDKKAKKAETNNLKHNLQKLCKQDPHCTHILLKGKTAICTDSTAKEKLEKLMSFLGGSVRGSGKNFAIGQLPGPVDESCVKRLTGWLRKKILT